MGNEELENNSENTEFNFVQEKIKPKSKKRLKKIMTVIGLSLLAGIVFGISSRVAFLKIGDPVAKLLGIEPVSGQEPPEPTGSGRNPVKFPTNPVTPTPTPKPTPTPVPKPTPSAQKPTPAPTQEGGPTDGANATDTQAPTDKPPATATNVPTNTNIPTQTDAPTQAPDGTATPGPDNPGDREGDKEATPTLSPLESYVMMIAQMRKVAGQVQDSLVRVYSIVSEANWLGESIETRQELTGVLMGDDGVELLVMTDYNAVEGADRLEVELDKIYDASLYSYDKDTNIAIVTIPLENITAAKKEKLSYMQLGSSTELYNGEPVIAVGRPNGYYGAVEFGFVSHKGIVRYIVDGELDEFTTDIYLRSGGDGIVTDLQGRLVGIIPHSNTEDGDPDRIIGIDSLKTLILRLLNGGGVPYFGIRSENIPEDVRTEMGIENGIYVNETFTNSPAVTAGIKKGDVIESVNGESIESVSQFYEYLLTLDEGTELNVKIFRASREDEFESEEIVVITKKE
ncbi:MAG: trypsin-like peptidase domain-containing protein [Lachnospiraceae bacterium]|nr:trypsin-like peptidase domain-containing protein [Lachnospiraceae bacterium]